MGHIDTTIVIFLVFVGLHAACASYPSYTTIFDYKAANVPLVNFLNSSRPDCSLKCLVNCYCEISLDANLRSSTETCAALPGYVKLKSSGGSYCKRIDYCANSCHGYEVKSAIPGGCQCTCPTCFSASSPSNSICTLNTSCCGPNSALSLTKSGSVVCTCQRGYRLVKGVCASTSETTKTTTATNQTTSTAAAATTTKIAATTTNATKTTTKIPDLNNGNANLGTNLGTV